MKLSWFQIQIGYCVMEYVRFVLAKKHAAPLPLKVQTCLTLVLFTQIKSVKPMEEILTLQVVATFF
jgi:hypothetical protein